MGFLFGNHKHLAKVSRLPVRRFLLDILKSIGWYGFSYGFFFVVLTFKSVSSKYILKKLPVTKKRAKSNNMDEREKGKQTGPPPPPQTKPKHARGDR
jgi:hypothetical protein